MLYQKESGAEVSRIKWLWKFTTECVESGATKEITNTEEQGKEGNSFCREYKIICTDMEKECGILIMDKEIVREGVLNIYRLKVQDSLFSQRHG